MESGLNLNNLSQASGISNAYLAKLVKGKINRPGKDKITSILLALNHTISEINNVLFEYDYQPLHLDDIPGILENNRSRKIVGGSLPQYDHIYFDLLVVVLERIGGNKILVKNRPSGSFMPQELYLMKEYPYEVSDAAAGFRYNLTRKILVERAEIFQQNLQAGYQSTTYICRNCLVDYLSRNIGEEAQAKAPRRSELVSQYFANSLSLSLKQPKNHQIYVIERCPYFHFLIQDAAGDAPKVSYPGRKLHTYDNEHDKRLLEGFTTDLPAIVAHFRHEVEMCEKAVATHYTDNFPAALTDEIFDVFSQYNMKNQLEQQLDALMSKADLHFY